MSMLDEMPIVPILMDGPDRGSWQEDASSIAYQDGLTDEPVEIVIAYDDDPHGHDHMFIAIGQVWAGFGYTARQACAALMQAKIANA